MDERRIPLLLSWLGAWQSRRPWRVLALGLATLLPALWGIAGGGGLGFRPELAELLPDNKPSVIELRRISSRLAGSSTLTVVAEIDGGQNPEALERFADRLAPRLRALGPEKAGAVDAGVKETRAFFEEHRLLFADTEALRQIHDEIQERYEREVSRAAGHLLDDQEPPGSLAESLEKRLQEAEKNAADSVQSGPPYPNGYYRDSGGHRIAVLIRTPVSGKAAKAALRAEVEGIVRSLDPPSFDPRLRVAYTGSFITSDEEYDAIVGDLMHVGGWGLGGVLLSVFLFFGRARTILALGVTTVVSLLWTFGLTRLTIGYLNSSTGFLVSIIAGNGINYGIMYMARYLEARREEGLDTAGAILVAHRDTWLPTLAGSTTAMLAYGSLLLTDFRGFKHFGVISAYGMILCWIATYALLPAVLAATERVLGASERPGLLRVSYGRGFAWLVRAAPRPVLALGLLAGGLGLYSTVRYFRDDPVEYNMRNVRNERNGRSAAATLNLQVDELVGRMGQDGMAIVTERVDQVPALEAALRRRWEAAPAGEKPFEKVVTIFSLLPRDQEQKIPLIEATRDRLERARKRGLLAKAQVEELERRLPGGPLKPLRVEDLPEQVARPFTERDGTRGRIVYIAPASGQSVWDARYLMRWADSFRSTTLPGGEVVKGSGQAVIFADMIKTIAEDTPKAIAFSAAGAIVVVFVAFRFHRRAWGVLLPWGLGIGGLFIYLFLSKTRLNFLNFVAIPITIGIGAEYAHNLMQRYRFEGPEQLQRVTEETGGAVVLCSLTTTIGYLALTLSINQGIRSFGLAAAVGEITCVLAAVLVLPAALGLRDKARRRALPDRGAGEERC